MYIPILISSKNVTMETDVWSSGTNPCGGSVVVVNVEDAAIRSGAHSPACW